MSTVQLVTYAAAAPLEVERSRAFDVYHAMFRASRQYMTGALVQRMLARWEQFEREHPGATYEDAERFADDLPEFQLFAWATRHFLRMRFYAPELGIVDAVHSQASRLKRGLQTSNAHAGPELRLNPDLKLPEYYTRVDYHQLRGGVWSDELAGMIYETGRRVALLTQSGDFNIYRWSYAQVPPGDYRAVLDWGTGAGAGLLEWQSQHPESECHGVDLSAACLSVAHLRARERGYRMFFSQQDLLRLDYADNSFDLALHMFMFHEIPVERIPAMLREAYRVLRPGGLFCGPEIRLTPGHHFLNVLQRNQAICTNEVYSAAWHEFDLPAAARQAGFSDVRIEPWKAVLTANKGGSVLPSNHFEYYVFRK